MPKPIPAPPDYQPPSAVQQALAAVTRLRAPDSASPEQYRASVAALQWIQGQVLDEWLRELARAQGSGALSHRRLVEVTGYKAHRNVQERVYEGRTLLEQ